MELYGLGPLPRGWEGKIEPKLGRVYYINHASKSTTWEDPRLASISPPPYHVAISQPTAYFEDTVGLNSRWSSPVPSLRGFSLHRRGSVSSPRLSGSPRIAPSPTPVIKTGGVPAGSSSHLEHLQGSAGAAHRSSLVSSILHSHSGQGASHGLHVQLQEKPIVLLAPDTESGSISSRPGSAASSRRQFPPMSHLISCDSETAYRTVCAIFPTASEVHIRHLFHKYHNRANVVVSALQVEKYPLCLDGGAIPGSSPPRDEAVGLGILHGDGDTDTILSIPDTKSIGISIGPASTASPARTGTPLSLVKTNQSSVGSLFTRSWGSPILSTQPSPKAGATKSPHLKLKYIRGIFPGADEGVLLEVLQSCENNVQKATESLLRRGFSKTPPPKPARQKWLEVKSLIEKRQRALESQRLVNFAHEIRGEPQESPFPTPLMKTARPHPSAIDKQKARQYLLDKFPTLPERFLSWALEASEFNKQKAERLLQEMSPSTPNEFKTFVQGIVPKITQPTSLNNNVEALNMKNLSRVLMGGEGDTPDSGYCEISSREPSMRDRRKHFISNLFHFRSKSTPDYVAASKRAKGPNMSLSKGSNPGLLGTKYIQTIGSSTTGPINSKGPNPSLRLGPQGRALGSNPIYARGSQFLNKLTKNRNHNNAASANAPFGNVVQQHISVTGY